MSSCGQTVPAQQLPDERARRARQYPSRRSCDRPAVYPQSPTSMINLSYVALLYGADRLMAIFRDALASGLLLLRHDDGWQVGLIAADFCIGDHGSVAFYAAALGIPFLKAVDVPGDLLSGSPTEQFIREAEPVNLDRDLHVQVLDMESRHDPARLADITSRSLGLPGDHGKAFRRKVYEILGLQPETPLRVLSFKPPDPITSERSASTLVTLMTTVMTEQSGQVRVRRYPAVLEHNHSPDDCREYVQISRDTEVDPRLRESAEIVVAPAPLGEHEAMEWLKRRLESTGVKLVAVVSGTRCLLRLRDGPVLEARTTSLTSSGTSPPDVEVTAAAVYAWLAEGKSFDQPVDITIRLTDLLACDTRISVVVSDGSAFPL
ncbi:hypothetical protein [Umezawaea sp. Da 62-37]|uniref:hypothetical protein n=1 Tax=Umezawaea sp. Da 62-37 TaxID=3075927 RepID=UPI0028F743B4|nr:hypothetical protein [Umezawaea sp. Da 62-37]WNV91488.1 hypothetical protein RM788_25490 [Umezawaea sp. Da 62-37]